jgi:hypothetical protein
MTQFKASQRMKSMGERLNSRMSHNDLTDDDKNNNSNNNNNNNNDTNNTNTNTNTNTNKGKGFMRMGSSGMGGRQASRRTGDPDANKTQSRSKTNSIDAGSDLDDDDV